MAKEESGFYSRQGKIYMYIVFHNGHSVVGTGIVSQGIKRPGRKARISNSEVKNTWSTAPTAPKSPYNIGRGAKLASPSNSEVKNTWSSASTTPKSPYSVVLNEAQGQLFTSQSFTV